MVDLSFLESFSRGDKSKMKRYIKMYLDVSPSIFQQMKTAGEAKDWESLRINAHSLKPQVDYMGIASLKECLVKIEGDITEGKVDRLEKLYYEALELHAESKVYLEKYIEES